MEDFMKFLGFKDITEEKPINYIERLPVTFENVYAVTSRWIRKQNGILTEILIGKEHYQIHIIGKSYMGDCYNSFSIQPNFRFYRKELEEYIYRNEQKVLEAFKRQHEVKLKKAE